MNLKGLYGKTVTVTLGKKAELEAELSEDRAVLARALKKILAQTQAAAARDRQLLDKASWYQEGYIYSEGFIARLAKSAAEAVKGAGVGIIHLFKEVAEMQARSSAAQTDVMMLAMVSDPDGHYAENLTAQQQQSIAAGQKLVGPLLKGLELLKLIYCDPQTRAMLEDFAKRYWHSHSSLMISKDIASFLGGVIPAIVVALITKNGSAFALEVTADSQLGRASQRLHNIAKLLKKLRKCKVVEGAEVDMEHEVVYDAAEGAKADQRPAAVKGEDLTEIPAEGGQEAETLLNPRVERFKQIAEKFLGKDYTMKLNKAGDPVFVDAENTRRIRFDANNPHGDEPHGHVEIKVGNRWKDYLDQHRIYLQEEPAPDNSDDPKPNF